MLTTAPLRGGISLAVMAALLLCQIGCSRGATPTGPATEPVSVAALLPADSEVAGWARSTEPETYDPDTLWEYIDGQAPMYLDYGFEEVVTCELSSGQGERAAAVDIFRMGTPEEAFGIYAAEGAPEDRAVAVGVHGRATSNVVNFWKGPYYVKVTSYTAAPDIEAELLALARTIERRIPAEVAPPPLLAVFPEEGRVPGSERYIPRDVLGQSYLSSGYRVDYDRDGATCQLVLVEAGTPEGALEALDRYTAFLAGQGAVVRSLDGSDPPLVMVQGDRWSVLFARGALLGGVVDVDSPELGRELAAALWARCP